MGLPILALVIVGEVFWVQNIRERGFEGPSRTPELAKVRRQIGHDSHLALQEARHSAFSQTSFPKQDLEEEVASLFYDVIKDFPELTFGVIAIRNAVGRFHVALDSVLVFKKVGLWSCCR